MKTEIKKVHLLAWFLAWLATIFTVAIAAPPTYNFFPPPGITWNASSSKLVFTSVGATTISTNGGPTADLSINASDSGSGGIAGFLNLSSGNATAGNTSGGAINLVGGNGSGSSSGGSFSMSAGTGGTTGAGGSVQLNAGTAGAGGGGAQLFLPGGPASGTAADVTLQGATGLTISTSGNVNILDVNANNSIQVTAAGLDNITELAASNAATFTVSGCSANTPTGGTWAGTYKSGVTGTCTVVVTPNVPTPAPHGWRCTADDTTTPADAQHQSAFTPTTCTITGTTVSGDVVIFSAAAF